MRPGDSSLRGCGITSDGNPVCVDRLPRSGVDPCRLCVWPAGHLHPAAAPGRFSGRRFRAQRTGRGRRCLSARDGRPRCHPAAVFDRPEAARAPIGRCRGLGRGHPSHGADHLAVDSASDGAGGTGASAARSARVADGPADRLRPVVLEHGIRGQTPGGSRRRGRLVRTHRDRHPDHPGHRGRGVPRHLDGQGAITAGGDVDRRDHRGTPSTGNPAGPGRARRVAGAFRSGACTRRRCAVRTGRHERRSRRPGIRRAVGGARQGKRAVQGPAQPQGPVPGRLLPQHRNDRDPRVGDVPAGITVAVGDSGQDRPDVLAAGAFPCPCTRRCAVRPGAGQLQ